MIDTVLCLRREMAVGIRESTLRRMKYYICNMQINAKCQEIEFWTSSRNSSLHIRIRLDVVQLQHNDLRKPQLSYLPGIALTIIFNREISGPRCSDCMGVRF